MDDIPFLVPAFTAREKTTLLMLVPSSLILFLTGIAFAWFVVLPQGLRFFLTFSSDFVQPLLSMESYLNFVFMLVLPFGILFNLPLVFIVLAKLDLITSRMLAKKRKYIVLLAFITPTTDILSQCLLALPMIILLEMSRLIIRYGLHR
ncbi:twin-arginine translocase subunit TatC [Megasphaera elsdenii]|uniref:twin-arginine translocase subunit TatC n=1 Tax=Megasphaera elsdenii TaxID=907 RepID=UPI001D02B884|nr:twin-arginine translocase subunit TatC [Megasphaera elsdenii]MCB5703624.1 twin-arginine translocase subunit TatC [Megasphaera elsdenii]MCB5728389.1 twin-arginine translocase subunit TatC [Megasphaera elsdenii]MCB5772167.1 twin-arginine translocase subunit TatC [Megasphaera elsdenii]